MYRTVNMGYGHVNYLDCDKHFTYLNHHIVYLKYVQVLFMNLSHGYRKEVINYVNGMKLCF